MVGEAIGTAVGFDIFKWSSSAIADIYMVDQVSSGTIGWIPLVFEDRLIGVPCTSYNNVISGTKINQTHTFFTDFTKSMQTDHNRRIVLVTVKFRIKITTHNQYIVARNLICDVTKWLIVSLSELFDSFVRAYTAIIFIFAQVVAKLTLMLRMLL